MYGKLFDELPVAQDGFDLKPTCFKILNEIELVFHVVIIKFFMIYKITITIYIPILNGI